mmetsp:Transcript_21680/g.55205  ORF Transcript_21680/g.55205 Transcript_21680/m.55205 type:complete len:213 (+) Transcript_21680:182-820(+)
MQEQADERWVPRTDSNSISYGPITSWREGIYTIRRSPRIARRFKEASIDEASQMALQDSGVYSSVRSSGGPHLPRQDSLAQHAGSAAAGGAKVAGRSSADCGLRRHGVHYPVCARVCKAGSDAVSGWCAGPCPRARAHTSGDSHHPGRASGQRLCCRAGHYAGVGADGLAARAVHGPCGLPGHTPGARVHGGGAHPQRAVFLHGHRRERAAG